MIVECSVVILAVRKQPDRTTTSERAQGVAAI
jgi:hypothetical protein